MRRLSNTIKRRLILTAIVLSSAGALLFPANDTLSVYTVAEASQNEAQPQQTANPSDTPAHAYSNNTDTPEDTAMDMYWLQKAAKKGDVKAQFMLSKYYYEGTNVEQDYTQAAYWLQKVAEHEIAPAQLMLAGWYHNGIGVEKNYKQEVYWLQKAADQGLAEAQTNLAGCYYYSIGIKQDYDKAVYWFKKAADLGYAKAQTGLGMNKIMNKPYIGIKKLPSNMMP